MRLMGNGYRQKEIQIKKKTEISEGLEEVRKENKERDGLINQKGLIRDLNDGPADEFGLNGSISQVQETGDTGNGPANKIEKLGAMQGTIEAESNKEGNLGTRDSKEKKKKEVKACYPQEMLAGSGVRAQGNSIIIMKRHHWHQEEHQKIQNGEMMQGDEHQWAGTSSLSDGCIANRNKVIHREMNIQEVRRIFSLGKRLGIEVGENDEEVQSRLMALEVRDEGQGRG
ncbi:hypothetical protein SLA2020_294180 [Shorea laevis]